jgi:hypothetical protein
MDKKLKKLISDYQTSVRTAIELIYRSGISLPDTAHDWVDTDICAQGELEGGVSYYKHGHGCLVDLPAGSVDFDFGCLGEIDGFDPWRLVKFAGSELARYGFENKDAVDRSFDAAVKSKELVSSGHILYYFRESERTLASEINRDIRDDLLPHYEQDKIVAMNVHSFLAADLMRKNYQKVAKKLENNKKLSGKDQVEFRIYFSSWLSYLYATCEKFDHPKMAILLAKNRPESFRELIGKSAEITQLIKLHKNPLRKLRNNVFHTREDVKPILQFAADEAGRLLWAGELHSSMAEFFSKYRILCEVHYLTHNRLGESQIRKQHAKKPKEQTC